jgi:hypothetical protein
MSAVREAAQAVVDGLGPNRGVSISEYVKLENALAVLREYEDGGATTDIVNRLQDGIAQCGESNTRLLLEQALAEIERLRKFEAFDKRLSDSARRERERGDDSMGPST